MNDQSHSKTASATRVLVIDDEKNIRSTLSVCLEGAGCKVTAVATQAAALEAVERGFFDIAFLDLRLGDTNGLDLLPRLLAANPGLAVVVITAYATIDTAIEAIKRGAVDYLPKPFTPSQIRHAVGQITGRQAIVGRVTTLESTLTDQVPEADLETAAPSMRSVLEVVARAAQSEAPILFRGESGTGKGVLARVLHSLSARANRPFVTVNCPTLSEELLTGELFGHARGSFTGAVSDRAGRVEIAEGGTLFLDEIAEISPALQAKLLRFLQDKQFERVGENQTRRSDVRIIAATNRDLETEVQAGRFREDLLFRLNVIEIRVPALRERPEDIVRMARAFLAFFARSAGRPVPELSNEAVVSLREYAWPGNVRELRNAMERAVILYPSPTLGPEAFPERMSAPGSHRPRLGDDVTLEQIEREHILGVLQRSPSLEDAANFSGSTLRPSGASARSTRSRSDGTDPRMRIIDFVPPEGVVFRLVSTDRAGALVELAGVLAAQGALDHAVVLARLREREELGTTGIGKEIAVPHAKLDVPRTLGVLGLSTRGIDFDAPDAQPVRILVALVSPEQGGGHLKALAAVAKELSDPAMRARLLETPSAAEVYALLSAPENPGKAP